MQKLLVICGPTSTGKTSLALKLAKKFDGEIVSADSRQVYKGMDIGTGKDIPSGSKIKFPWFGKYGYYEINDVPIWGYDLADPRHEFNISQYIKFADRIILDITKRGKLPILVGGTGFYIKGVTDGIGTAGVPKNSGLRENLENKAADELYNNLANINSVKAASLNSSDRKNPRRLIRAIEVSQYMLDHKSEVGSVPSPRNILFIGLKAPSEFIEKRIDVRVLERVKNGIKNEIGKLLKAHVNWDMQSMSGMGYGEWRGFFEGKTSERDAISEWELEEKKYAKRQMTWFKKESRINWFDVSKSGYPKNVENSVEKWYSSSNAS